MQTNSNGHVWMQTVEWITEVKAKETGLDHGDSMFMVSTGCQCSLEDASNGYSSGLD